MSTQKGNSRRTRPQKYQNQFAFKNTLHDTSVKTKVINSLQISDVCERCKKIIEWKIKYKKYKPLKAPAKCNKCEQKTIKHAYHTICGPCAKEQNVCPKCGSNSELVQHQPSKEEQIKLDVEMQKMLKALPERRRRTFIRYMNKQAEANKGKKKKDEENEASKSDYENTTDIEKCTHEDLLNKLKALAVEKDSEEDDEFDSDFSDNDDSDSVK